METSIVDFHKRFYIPVIQKLALHLPHVRIIGTRHCSNKCQEKFNSCAAYQDVLCCQDYAEHVLASFAHQIQSEYYGGNKYFYITGIVLEDFSATEQGTSLSYFYSCKRHGVF